MRARSGFWLWPKLFSLDAPLVAVSWQLLFSKVLHVYVAPIATAVTALAVWLIYVTDRILDSFRENQEIPVAARHTFYRAYRSAFMPPIVAVLLLTCWMTFAHLSRAVFRDGIFLASVVGGYFLVIHILHGSKTPWRNAREWVSKELVVAILFGAGTCLPVYAGLPSLTPSLFAAFLLFVFVLWMNTLLIEYSEWMNLRHGLIDRPHWSTILAGNHFLLSAGGVVLLGLGSIASGRFEALCPVLLSEVASGLALAGVYLYWRKNSSCLVGPVADAALLAPLVYLILHHS